MTIMKKVFFTLVAALMAATATYAQSSLVATLSHNGEIAVFHGATSLKQAMEAAEHGDIITLASGRYDAVDITKAVTLRGAGMEEDSITGAFRTQIVGDFAINIADSINEHLTMEGLYHESTITMYGTLSNTMLQKCQFKSINRSDDNNTVNSLTCIHCYITDHIGLPKNCSANFISSVIQAPNNRLGGNMEFTNCVILFDFRYIFNSFFTNCFFYGWNNGYDGSYGGYNCCLNNTNMATYCAGCTRYHNPPFTNIPSSTNKTISEKDFNALFKPNTFYVLTDEAKKEYIGNDGTEIGIYGGNLPYNTRILSPQITKCNVAAKTTADGKLSVDIEVKAAE